MDTSPPPPAAPEGTDPPGGAPGPAGPLSAPPEASAPPLAAPAAPALPETRPVEAWAAAKGITSLWLHVASVREGWCDGVEVTEEEFTTAIHAAKHGKIR